MKKLLAKFKILLTGGRPMIKLGYAFTDFLSGEKYYDFIDQKGRLWVANGKWSLTRMKDSEEISKQRRPTYLGSYF